MKRYLFALCALFSTTVSHAAEWFVSPIGSDSADGKSWATARQTIQSAIDSARTKDEIIVAKGRYLPISSNDKYITIKSIEGALETIIDGGNTNRCATLGFSGSHTNTVLIGFTLTKGRAGDLLQCGGGSYGGSLTDCVITENEAYGGGGSYGGVLVNCTISKNIAGINSSTTGFGGGCAGSILKKCTITENTATMKTSRGGGAYNCQLQECLVSNNTAFNGGGLFYGDAVDCIIEENDAFEGGGCYGGRIKNSIIQKNSSSYGGGTFSGLAPFEINVTDCVVSENIASMGGGSYGGTLTGCVITRNNPGKEPSYISPSYGGGAYGGKLINCVVTENMADFGGGFYAIGGGVSNIMINCLVSKNEAQTGGGVNFLGGTIINCTVAGNLAREKGGGIYGGEIINSIIWGNECTSGDGENYEDCIGTYSCAPGLSDSNISENPQFVDSENGNFTLRAESPCIDMGNTGIIKLLSGDAIDLPSIDVAGNPRILDGRIDIGAFEGGRIFRFSVSSNCGNRVTPSGEILLSQNETLSLTASEDVDGRAFIGFFTNGVFAASDFGFTINDASFEWSPIKKITIDALYSTYAALDCNGGRCSVKYINTQYGQPYSELPNPVRLGYLFMGWSLDQKGFWGVDSETCVTNQLDHTLYAQWIRSEKCTPEINHEEKTVFPASGIYNGFLHTETENGSRVAGTFSLTLNSKTGKITVGVVTENKKITFTGDSLTGVAPNGIPFVTLIEKTGRSLTIYLTHNDIWGDMISENGEILLLDGARDRFADKTDLDAQAMLARVIGSYTAIQYNGEDGKTGNGYLTLSINDKGVVKMAGVLPDGTAYSQSSPLTFYKQFEGHAALFPIFSVLKSGQEQITGLLWLTDTSENGRCIFNDYEGGWPVRWQSGKSITSTEIRGAFWNSTPLFSRELLFTAIPGLIPWYEEKMTTPSENLRWDTVENGLSLFLNTKASSYTVPKAELPFKDTEGHYNFSGVNSGKVTFSLTAKTGVFKGKFNGYVEVPGMKAPVLRTAAATYAGVFLQASDGSISEGSGHALVAETEPAAKKAKVKRSFPVYLQ